jgi:hypothetical protein
MATDQQTIFVAPTKVLTWSPWREMRCASCGGAFAPDVVDEDGKKILYWVGFMWSKSSGAFSPSEFCWGCASLFMRGDYRGAAHDYEVDLQEFGAAIQRVVRRERHRANNPQESDYPGVAVELIDYILQQAGQLEAAHVVSPDTFNRECRVGWPYE